MEPILKTCPHCGTVGILIMADGRCPHCKKLLCYEDKKLFDLEDEHTGTKVSTCAKNESHTEKTIESILPAKDLSVASDDELSACERNLPEKRWKVLVIVGIVLIVVAVVGMIIGHNIIRAAARSGSYAPVGFGGFNTETVRLNNLARKEGALDIIMGVVILSGLALLIVGLVERRCCLREKRG